MERSFTVHPFAFIVKPIQVDKFYNNLDDYLKYYTDSSTSEKQYAQILTKNQWVRIEESEICYFQYLENRQIEVVLKNGKSYYTKGSIANLYETLNQRLFIVPQQSFIINMEYIKNIDLQKKIIKMQNNMSISISRQKFNDIINQINAYVSK